MLLITFFILILNFFGAILGENCERSITTVNGLNPVCSGQLIFFEDFNTLNTNVWKHEVTLWGGGNGEFQWYVSDSENCFVKNGNLYIKPTLTSDYLQKNQPNQTVENAYVRLDDCTDENKRHCELQATADHILNPIRSARLRTKDSFSFKYGRVEVSAKMPTGDWLWPAIWLLPTEFKYGTWPRSGEIDLVESRGNRNYVNHKGEQIGVKNVAATLHFGPIWNQDAWETAHYEKNNPYGFNHGFHNYTFVWDESGIRFFFDQSEIGFVAVGEGFWQRGGFSGENIWSGNSKMAPFDQEFHFVINLAVGGTNYFFPDIANQNKPWINSSPTAAADFWKGRNQWMSTWNTNESHYESSTLAVDYVKVYAID